MHQDRVASAGQMLDGSGALCGAAMENLVASAHRFKNIRCIVLPLLRCSTALVGNTKVNQTSQHGTHRHFVFESIVHKCCASFSEALDHARAERNWWWSCASRRNQWKSCVQEHLQGLALQAKELGYLSAGQNVLDIAEAILADSRRSHAPQAYASGLTGSLRNTSHLSWTWRGWRSIDQTPDLYWPELDSTRGFVSMQASPRFAPVVEAVSRILHPLQKEILSIFRPSADGGERGDWMQKTVWSATSGWRVDSCSQLPSLCSALAALLPTIRGPLLRMEQEQVELFGMPPNTSLPLHNDGGNERVSMSMCIFGCEGGWLEMRGEKRRWLHDGGWLFFDPSWDHKAGNDGNQERWVVQLSLAHPDYENPQRFQSIQTFTKEWALQCADRNAHLLLQDRPAEILRYPFRFVCRSGDAAGVWTSCCCQYSECFLQVQ